MKKINFKNLSIDEVLSKDELRKITGGNGSDPFPCDAWSCSCPGGAPFAVSVCGPEDLQNMWDRILNDCPEPGFCDPGVPIIDPIGDPR